MPTVTSLSPTLEGALTHEVGEVTVKELESLCLGVMALSRLFTRGRDGLLQGYLDSGELLRAYVSYFLPVNLCKVQSILHELPPLEESGNIPDRKVRILDVGSGPGTGALGVLDWIFQRHGVGHRSVEGVLIDRARPALLKAENLWTQYLELSGVSNASLKTVPADVEKSGVLERLGSGCEPGYDIVVVANTLNELFLTADDPLGRRVRLVKKLFGLLSDRGTLIIMEPALRNLSRDLHRLRDVLVEEGLGTIYSPCLHDLPCPALVKNDDWCHEERPWRPTSLVAAIDRQVGFIKDALKFSYLVFRKDGRTIVDRRPQVYRIVSELRHLKGEKRVWVCNELGRTEIGRLNRNRSEPNQHVDDLSRGAIVRIGEIVRKEKKGHLGAVGRIPTTGTLEIIREV